MSYREFVCIFLGTVIVVIGACSIYMPHSDIAEVFYGIILGIVGSVGGLFVSIKWEKRNDES
jgi:hypothetical protein